MRNFDFSSWEGVVSAILSLLFITLLGVGVRMMVMMTIQQRRERMNRQINERLRTLMAAYKTLGGSFTGDLMVDPRHKRDAKRAVVVSASPENAAIDPAAMDQADATLASDDGEGPDRPRRIRDAVEAALSDIILLGTEDQVRLAARAARELVEGRPVHTHDLVIALRDFIREALDLDAIPDEVIIPQQGPTRPASSSGGGRKGEASGAGGGRAGGGGSGGGGMGMGMGIGMGGGFGVAHGASGVSGSAVTDTDDAVVGEDNASK